MGRSNNPLILSSYIERNKRLRDLINQLQRADTEQDDLLALLPQAFRDRVRVRRHQDELTLIAANNAVAQMLRFQGQSLLKAAGCDRLKVRVAPMSPTPNRALVAETPKVERKLSASTSELLEQTADDINDDELADALRRLARNATK